MDRVVESLYSSVGKYGIKLNEDLDNKKPVKGIKCKLKEEVMGIDNSNKIVYYAKPGQGTVTSLIKQLGHCKVISFSNTDEMSLIGNSPVIFDEIERFDRDALEDAINILRDAPNKVVVVTYDPIIAKAFSDCGVKTIDLRKSIKEEYSLVGQDGNAFSLMGYTARCMKECGISKDEIDRMYEEATSGDYNNLLVVCNDYIQRCNALAEEEGLFECAEMDESYRRAHHRRMNEDMVDNLYDDYSDIFDKTRKEFANSAFNLVRELILSGISDDDAIQALHDLLKDVPHDAVDKVHMWIFMTS